jgi:hypothetical protein
VQLRAGNPLCCCCCCCCCRCFPPQRGLSCTRRSTAVWQRVALPTTWLNTRSWTTHSWQCMEAGRWVLLQVASFCTLVSVGWKAHPTESSRQGTNIKPRSCSRNPAHSLRCVCTVCTCCGACSSNTAVLVF